MAHFTCKSAAFVFFLLLTFHAISLESHARQSQEQIVRANYCPYFKNRAPSPQPHLKNCTWYRENSCCLQHELEIIFGNIPSPEGASEKCREYMNYFMCYVCAPNQNIFYSYAQERITVCEEFCNEWFDACGEAKLKGTKIKSAYKTGKEFCYARKFSVKKQGSKECFSYGGDAGTRSSATTKGFSLWTMVLAGVFVQVAAATAQVFQVTIHLKYR